MAQLFSAEDYQEWTQRLREKDATFANKIMKSRSDLRIKQLLDGRREEMRYAITVASAARLLGIDPKTLRKKLEDPYNVHLEQIRPLKKGHRYLWLEDVLEYSKKMTEMEY